MRAIGAVRRAERALVVILGASIPVSIALDNVLLGLIAALWLCGGAWRDKLRAIAASPVALAALALFGWLALGMGWSQGSPADRVEYLGKYKELAFVALLLWPFADRATRTRALIAFGGACAVTLAASYALHFGLIAPNNLLQGNAANPVAFKLQITHNILMAAAAFLFASYAAYAARPARRWACAGLALAAVYNVLFMVRGRTGYLMLFVLLLLFVTARWRWRGFAVGLVASVMLFGIAYQGSETFQRRVTQAFVELAAASPERPAAYNDSVGLRLEFYRNTAAIVAEHPLLGVGTGGFPAAYADKVRGSGRELTRNPHNEYLLIASQSGLVGLALFIALLALQWRAAARLAGGLERDLARGLVLAMALGCLTNSLLLDHTEGLYYAWLSALLFGGPAAPAAATPEGGDAG
ncbi:MAG TPA: O-antigen ligase family protein [Burkholderiales bacterium]|nr:O-antigen ligase family protein [Burkholderiales bacterium]